MKTYHLLHVITILCALTLLAGCTSGERITDREGLFEAVEAQDVLRVQAGDRLYRLHEIACTESTLSGVGIEFVGDSSRAFRGSLPLSEISYLERHTGSGFNVVLGVLGGGAIAVSALTAIANETDIHGNASAYTFIHVPSKGTGSGGGGGSCPTIYAGDGVHESLQGEAFAVAWGRAFAMTTTTPLPALKPDGDSVSVTVRNERPETHYHDALRLLSAQVPAGAQTVVDTRGRLLMLTDPSAPSWGADGAGGEVAADLNAADARVWHSRRESAHAGGTFTDRIDLQFETGAPADSGLVIVTARNTDIFPVMLSYVADILGERSLDFVRALEQDSVMIGLIKGWLERAALRVMVGSGDRWVEAGRILPEASMTTFTRALPIALTGGNGCVQIRLECLSDVWTLDAVSLDAHAPHAVTWIPSQGTHVHSTAHGTVTSIVSEADDRYVIALPGDDLRITSPAVHAGRGERVVYALRATGYLHEWIPGPNARSIASLVPPEQAIGYVKTLLRQPDILLPPMYARWSDVAANTGR